MNHTMQSALKALGMKSPTLRNHIACVANAIQLAMYAFMNCLGVKCHTKSCEAHDHKQRFVHSENTEIWMSHKLGQECNARINKASAMRPGLAKMIEKVPSSR